LWLRSCCAQAPGDEYSRKKGEVNSLETSFRTKEENPLERRQEGNALREDETSERPFLKKGKKRINN